MKCDTCGKAVKPFEIVHGYTITFDETRSVGLTLPQAAAETLARDADHYAALRDGSRQHSILTFAPSDMPGTLVRMRPFLGQLVTCPSIAMPDSHNAGDFGAFLVGAPADGIGWVVTDNDGVPDASAETLFWSVGLMR